MYSAYHTRYNISTDLFYLLPILLSIMAWRQTSKICDFIDLTDNQESKFKFYLVLKECFNNITLSYQMFSTKSKPGCVRFGYSFSTGLLLLLRYFSNLIGYPIFNEA